MQLRAYVAIAAVGVVIAVGAAVATGSALATTPDAGTSHSAPTSPLGTAVTVHVVDAVDQAAAREYWTPARMAAAAAGAQPQAIAQRGALSGTPSPVSFPGVPTVGALFYTVGSNSHFCTGSVVNSTAGSLVLTAAHCVDPGSYVKKLAFVPDYQNGSAPYGTWTVTRITVASGWSSGENPDLDVAFLDVAPPPHSIGPIEQVTGGLNLAFALPDAQHITVIGYNDTDQQPIWCATKSFRFSADMMEFRCHGFSFGTSGGPWIIGYNSGSGTGTVFGLIGGYEWGGYQPSISYSPTFERPAEQLFKQAEALAAR
jgi:V8-like Glu-specific endopeptidase